MENRDPTHTNAEHMTGRVENGSQDVPYEKVFHFGSAREPSEPGRRDFSIGRDWAAAIDLVKEASEAIRIAEKKAAEAERYAQQLANHHKEQLKAAEIRAVAAERRADAALKRASEAEEWLMKFHDAIVSGFEGFVKQVA